MAPHRDVEVVVPLRRADEGALVRAWALVATFVLCACGPAGSTGVGFVRFTELDDVCPVTFEPQTGDPVIPTTLDFQRAHATVGFEQSARFPGGSLVVAAWQEADGTVKRLYVELGPTRGYGGTKTPSPTWVQAVGYVEWKDGQRVFGGTHVDGLMLNQASTKVEKNYLGTTPAGQAPGSFFTQLAFAETTATGPKCRVISMHAEAEAVRENAYDPQWLKANPTVMQVDGQSLVAPTFEGDFAPGTALVAPGTMDPEGPAPRMVFRGGTLGPVSGEGVGSCD